MKILWVDDEIEGFKPHIIFLQKEGVQVEAVDRPTDAIEALKREGFDLILIDYRMPEMDGLSLFREVKKIAPNTPVALVTMVSDRDVMEESISEDVFDYLLKPIQPSQILALVNRLRAKEIKNRVYGKRLVETYRKFEELDESPEGWLSFALEFARMTSNFGLDETLRSELRTTNLKFARWIMRNYADMIHDPDILMSHRVMSKVFPYLDDGKKIAFFLFDNFRLDQFVELMKELPSGMRIDYTPYYALLPTATPFARNGIFAGLLPIDIERRHPGWTSDNRHEHVLLRELLNDSGYTWADMWLYKIRTPTELASVHPHDKHFEAYVVNFIDLLSHIRLEVDVLKEMIADGDSFKHWCRFILDEAGIGSIIRKFVENGYVVFMTSDHGWVEGTTPLIIKGGIELTQGLRYKFGDSVRIAGKEALLIKELEKFGLPRKKNAGRLALAIGYSYFIYSSNPSKFKKTYHGGIYHGGITIEEMIVPLIKISH